jgi:SanA protein
MPVNIGVYAGAVRDHQALMFRKVLFAFWVLATVCVAALIAGRIVIAYASKGKTYSNVSLIPHRRVGLILGCPKRTFGGWPNPYFENRIAAAAELYYHRKIDYFVVSGDNHVQRYDEPTDMKNALIDKGVPADRVYLDSAGFRTLDSVVRVKEIFSQERVTIISQKFQNQRAIFLADHHGIDAIGFNAPEVTLRYGLKTTAREQLAKVKAVLDVYLFHKQPHFLGPRITVGNPPVVLDAHRASELAELMCRQLPNVGTFLENHIIVEAKVEPGEKQADADEVYDPIVTDDTYDALDRLGAYSLPCLVNRLTDTRWMPDPRSEPLLGVPVVGDVAYMILGDKGVPDVLPALAHKKPNELRMDDYFLWPSVGDNRQRLQNAVEAWLRSHPDCCRVSPIALKSAPAQARFRMSDSDLGKARTHFSQLRPGMGSDEILKIAGRPDAIDAGGDSPEHYRVNLLGFCSGNHNENLAYIYFVERWREEIARRDPLHDQYVILYFSGEGKFTRMFSNIADIPPVFPRSSASWQQLMWGEGIKAQ